MRRCRLATWSLLALCLTLSPGSAQTTAQATDAAAPQTAPPPSGPLTLEAALERAVTFNPTVEAARRRRLMALAERDVARERLNPEARLEIERETPTESF